MEIRTGCPSRCKYISGDKCIASECPYQTDERVDRKPNDYKPDVIFRSVNVNKEKGVE